MCCYVVTSPDARLHASTSEDDDELPDSVPAAHIQQVQQSTANITPSRLQSKAPQPLVSSVTPHSSLSITTDHCVPAEPLSAASELVSKHD